MRAFLFALTSLCLAASASAFPTAILSGTTRDDHGNPVPGVSVSFEPAPYYWTYLWTNVISDSNGQFSVNLPQGPWKVRGSIFSNYQPSPTQTVVLQTNTSIILTLRSNSPNCFITGRLLQENGVPLTFYQVAASLNGGLVYTFTDGTGAFRFPAYGGTWTLTAGGSSGYMFPERQVHVTDGLDATNVTLIRREAATIISGTLRCPDGGPFSYLGLTAKAEIEGEAYTASTSSDFEGNFHFELPKGTWTVDADYWSGPDAPCALDLPQTFSLTTNRSLEIGGGPKAILEGRVVDENGNALPGVTVEVSAASGFSIPRFITTDPNGHFNISAVPGSLWIAPEPPAGFLGALLNQPVLAVSGRTNKLQFVLRRVTAHIMGSVVTKDGIPISGALVEGESRLGNDDYFLSAYTDAAGHFDLAVANGSWGVTPRINQSCYWLCYRDVAPRLVEIQENSQSITFQAEPIASLAHIRGRVLNQQDQPLTDLLISAVNISEVYSLLIRASDSQGNFDFEVFDGVWTLGSWAGGPVSDLLPQVSATVTNQTDRDGVILRGLSRERYLNCSVKTENGEPLLNMAIQAERSVNGLRYMDQAATEIDGSAFLHLPSGQWRVRVSDQGLNAAGFQSIPAQVVDLLPGTNTIPFVARPFVGDPVSPRLRSGPLPDGAVEVNVSSQTFNAYCIQISEDLRNWTPFLTNYTENGSFNFIDSRTNATQRFYRAFLLP